MLKKKYVSMKSPTLRLIVILQLRVLDVFLIYFFYHWIKVDLIKKRVADFLLKKVNVLGFI